jgi:hypothetical protein
LARDELGNRKSEADWLTKTLHPCVEPGRLFRLTDLCGYAETAARGLERPFARFYDLQRAVPPHRLPPEPEQSERAVV